MFSDFIGNIKNHYKANLPFVAYRKPNENSVKAVFQNSAALHEVKDFKESGFVFAPFDTRKPAILLKADIIDITEFSGIANGLVDESRVEPYYSEEEKNFHINLVEKGIKEIKGDSFKKVVLSRAIRAEVKLNPTLIFQKLLASYPTAFCYLWYHPKVGLWLGATPEKFLSLDNDTITTNALAGTQAYHGDLQPIWGQKEKYEQQLVTDYIHNALKDVVTTISVSDVSTVRAGGLLHLKTSISGKVKPDLLPDIIVRLHPTPAVCGLPKESSKSFILENENYDREFYTGFLGELNFTSEKKRNSNSRNVENGAYRAIKKSTELFVNLRCIQIVDALAFIYVGGGVTKDSDSEKEWEETINKSHTMLRVLNAK